MLEWCAGLPIRGATDGAGWDVKAVMEGRPLSRPRHRILNPKGRFHEMQETVHLDRV